MPVSETTIFVLCSTYFDMWRGVDVRGGCFRTIFRRGTRCTSSFAGRLAVDVFETLVADAQYIVREWGGRKGQPTAVYIDSRTLQSTPESGRTRRLRRRQAQEGIEGAHRRRHARAPAALKVTAANEGDREQLAALAERVQQVTGNTVKLAYVDQGYTGLKLHNNMAYGWKW